MKTRVISRNCILSERKNAFWVECTDEEVIMCILPKVTKKLSEIVQQIKQNRGFSRINPNENEQIYCNFFLVSTDLEEIKSYNWVMPYGGMWNGGNPFREIEVVDFYSLDELKDIWETVKEK